ncbi:response regulator [Granulicella sibirica]|nr:response regulator [Granulicella sibirica]
MAFNVLLVDDSPSMRKVIRRVLMLSGFDVGTCLEAGDGLEALQVLEDEWIDVVITDINMPNMNGEELVVKLSEDPMRSSIPVLVVSTDRSDERLTRMMSLGARGYVTKPFLPETLGAAMGKIVGEPNYASSSF